MSFDDLMERVHTRADLNYPDRVVDMRHTHVTPTLDFQVPGMGIMELTPWSKSQLSTYLGVRWDKWFENIDYNDVQTELQRRFERAESPKFLIRGRRHLPGEEKAQNQGVLRAFLSTGYHPVDDVRVFDAFQDSAFGANLELIQFVHWKGALRSMFTDKSSHMTGIVGDPIQIPHFAEGDMEPYYHGFHFRNSETGFSSVTIDDFWFRIECLNGMMVMVGRSSLFRRRHVAIEDADLVSGLNQAWEGLIDRRDRVEMVLEDACDEELRDPQQRMRAFLSRRSIPKRVIDAAVEELEDSGATNRLAVVQAITATARDIGDPDSRRDLEIAAGAFLQAA